MTARSFILLGLNNVVWRMETLLLHRLQEAEREDEHRASLDATKRDSHRKATGGERGQHAVF